MKKVLGLDLGVASIGWSLISVDDNDNPLEILGMGSRIVPISTEETNDYCRGNSKSKNMDRTLKRTARKGHDRYGLRREALTAYLRENGMLPDEALIKLPVLELWQLRAKAATKGEKLTLPEIGRVLYHLNQKRGYKHAKADANDAQQRDYVKGINARYAKLKEEGLTIGQLFAKRLKENKVVNEDGGVFYTYRIKDQVYPRQAYMDEFDTVMACQREFYPEILNDEAIHHLRNEVIYYQRALKSCKHLVSMCELAAHHVKMADGTTRQVGPKVAPKSSPLFQLCKIWEEVNNITIKNRRNEELFISTEQRELMVRHLLASPKLTVTDVFRILNINKSDGWWGGKAIGKGLQGDTTRMALRDALDNLPKHEREALLRFNTIAVDTSMVDEETGEIKQELASEIRDENGNVTYRMEYEPLYMLWHMLYSIKDPSELANALCKGVVDKNGKQILPAITDEVTIERLCNIDFVKQGFGNKSVKIMRQILPCLALGMKYSEACEYIGTNHSSSMTKAENKARELLKRLPQIQKNELRQPIVEKILNQMINVVNAIKEKYGEIDVVRVELARELKQSKDERDDTSRRIGKQERENAKNAQIIQKEFNLAPTRNRLQKYRMWIETGEKCIYCDKHITAAEFLSGDHNANVEHIVPKALLFDDSFTNKTCSCRKCNNEKKDRTAYDYMRSKGELDAFQERVLKLKDSNMIGYGKYQRLMASYEDYQERKRKGKETDADKQLWENFIDRQMRESQYISRKAMEILKQAFRDVYATSGAVTDFLRHLWGYDTILHTVNFGKYKLDGLTEFYTYEHNGQTHEEERIKDWSKRLDHRHHAIDALVIALTRQGYIQRVNTLNAEREEMYKDVSAQSKEWQERFSLLEKWTIDQPHFSVGEVTKNVESILVSQKAGKKAATIGKRYVYENGKKSVAQERVIVPRGALHEETIYGSIKRPGAKKPEIVVRYKMGVGMGFLFDGKETVTDKKDKIMEKVESIVDSKIREVVYERLNKGLGTDGYKKNVEKALNNFRNLDEEPLYADKLQKIEVKSVRCYTGLNEVTPLREENGKVTAYVKTGNNHHIAFYRDKEGKLQEHVVTFWHAVERKKYGVDVIVKNPSEMWSKLMEEELPEAFLSKLPQDGWEFVESLQQNEMFVMGLNEAEYKEAIETRDMALLGKHLYKVQNISAKTYRFSLHTETSYDLSQATNPSKKYLNIRSIGAFEQMIPHKVRITILGDLYD